ncbi:MAG: toll/interleukin-1 receptor domain-containing protein [Anaerolineae bacterium]|nr:toll/interleukin-1 receptor domain-containing protein [Anaerolineae bacterium]
MANEEQLAILKRGVEEWNRWRTAHLNEPIELAGVDLRETVLRGAYLHGADLSGSLLIGADLREADLGRADLSVANLSGARLHRMSLKKAVLSGADLRKAIMSGADLREADLREADLRSAVLHKTILAKANLTEAVATEADLHEADLRQATLCEVNLSRTTMHEANLYGADLSEADLCEAKMVKVDLSRAIMREADLRGTNLSEADLRKTDLHGAYLDETILIKSICGETVFANVDLSSVLGLETVWHYGRSMVGVDTLFRSKGKIPEVFLRGCGVPENLITFLPSMLEDAIQFYSCFISYSHADKDFALRLHDRLQRQGIRCWLDEHQLKPGDKLHKTIYDAIRVYDKVILCCSEASLTSWWVNKEFENVLGKEESYGTELLIPVDLDGYVLRESDAWVAGEIKKRYVQPFVGWKDHDVFEAAFAKVVKALRTDGGSAPPPEPKLKRKGPHP